MAFEPADSLRSRTYVGLVIAQFLAAFNDQAIQSSAMFWAISKQSMTEKFAISLLPILFYAPWAIFVTIAGYLADRFSKRQALVFWKFAEVGITLVALFGFWLGSVHNHWAGPFIVLSTVFLMGTHSAFFVPAKYGAMPEILRPEMLSRGNGVLESTSFLAVILGTVCGGVLAGVFRNEEYFIGLILFGLALIGAGASLLIQKMPAANPTRPFPKNLFKPVMLNLRTMWSSRPLRLALMGIAFFTFLVAFMRSTLYMHGEAHVPRWPEFKTSLVVGTTAIGISLGGLLAGFFSGGKVELGLVPLGALGMLLSAVVAAFFLTHLAPLIACIILIGFFSGFYTLPLFTLLQHRAPKASKGDSIATSNLINVVGAITASILFAVLVSGAEVTGIAPSIQPAEFTKGELNDLIYDAHNRLIAIKVDDQEIQGGSIELKGFGLTKTTEDDPGSQVIVSKYRLRDSDYYQVRAAGSSLKKAYDHEMVPRYLFLGAGFITLICLIALCWELPDFFLRSLLWLHSLGRYRLQVVGVTNLPGQGPAILAINSRSTDQCLEVLTVSDRYVRFLLLNQAEVARLPGWLRYLVGKTNLLATPTEGGKLLKRMDEVLQKGELLGVPILEEEFRELQEKMWEKLHQQQHVPIIPVYCGSAPSLLSTKSPSHRATPVRIVIGQALPPQASVEMVRQEIQKLGAWIEGKGNGGEPPPTTLEIPRA